MSRELIFTNNASSPHTAFTVAGQCLSMGNSNRSRTPRTWIYIALLVLGGLMLPTAKVRADGRRHAADAVREDESSDPQFVRMGVLVIGSYKSYDAALRAAKSYGQRSGHQYDSRGMVYDKRRGLIWPDDSEDEIWAGAYAPRRYDTECAPWNGSPCVTVERSAEYEGFAPGLYIVVDGILDRSPERAQRLAAARKLVSGAYVKDTDIYMGCMH